METRAIRYGLRGLALCVFAAAVAVMLVGLTPAKAETFSGSVDSSYNMTVKSSKRAFSVTNNVLYQTKSGVKTQLKALPVSGDEYWGISAAYKKNVYLTKKSFEKWKMWTYAYNLKTKKLKKVKGFCDIIAFKGKYAYAAHDYKTDVSAGRMDVYKMTSSGLKHVKKLTKYGFQIKVIGKKIYYTAANNTSMSKNTLYKAKLNGKGKKKIVSFRASGEYGQAIIFDIAKKNCKVSMDGAQYLYTYKTKRLAKVS